MNGKQASFTSGGEFPVPVVQGGANVGAVTIQFREFGVRLNFTPTITPRGTIRLQVNPEVSSLDYNNAVVLQGFTVPAIATRKVQTEIELENGQSFVIAGLLDNRFTETLDKIPGLANIPLLGKLFQSRILQKNNSELLVLVTPEIVRPIAAGQPRPEIPMPKQFLKDKDMLKEPPRTPGVETTGPMPVKPERETVPVEELQELQKKEQGAVPGSTQPTLLLPLMMNPAGGPAAAAAPGGPPANSDRLDCAGGAVQQRHRRPLEPIGTNPMYSLTLGLAIETKQLWDEIQSCLPALPLRTVIEHQDMSSMGPFLDRLERLRPEVVLLDVAAGARTVVGTGAADSLQVAGGDHRSRPQLGRSGCDFVGDASGGERVSLSAARIRITRRAGTAFDRRTPAQRDALGSGRPSASFPRKADAAPPRWSATWPWNWGASGRRCCWRIWTWTPGMIGFLTKAKPATRFWTQ